MSIGHFIESLLVVLAVALALGYALLALLPQGARRRLALLLGAHAPGWLARRLVGRGGCDSCPANQMLRAPRRTP